MACFNDGATLPDALGSLDREEECELVVVDDGSDDPRTLQVLDELRVKGVRVLRQANQGVAGARMTGLDATTAPYVFPFDADDLIAPGALTALADALDANPSAAAAWGDVETFGDVSTYQPGPRSLDPWLLTYLNDMTGGATMVRRDRLVEVGGWRMQGGYETWDVWLGLAERGWHGIYVPRLVLRYRKHGVRRLAATDQRFAELYGQLRDNHRALFESRRALWRRSRASWRFKLALPIIELLPLAPRSRARLRNLLVHPTHFLLVRRARLSGPLGTRHRRPKSATRTERGP